MIDTSLNRPFISGYFRRRERHVPDALTDKQILDDLMRRAVDHRDAIGWPERDESDLAVARNIDSHRLNRFTTHPTNVERDLVLEGAHDRINHADRPANFGGYPKFSAVLLEFGVARADQREYWRQSHALMYR